MPETAKLRFRPIPPETQINFIFTFSVIAPFFSPRSKLYRKYLLGPPSVTRPVGIVYHDTSGRMEESYHPTATKRIIFDSLQGDWRLSRTLKSTIASYPSGALTGNAKFEQRTIIASESCDESLYSEEGEFVTDGNLTMRARRQYAYRYEEEVDKLSVWFVKSDQYASTDYLFHYFDFTDEGRGFRDENSGMPGVVLVAKGHHLCVDDDYTAEYTFTFLGQVLMEWAVKYIVKGPHKDYVAHARYTRPELERERG